MNELSLFTGAGGGVLGTMLLGFRHIGYVEWDGYCQKILAQRIKDGILDYAPIFGDVRAFVSEGYAASYTGMVDVLTAGFPCQPFSVAGKQKGADDERNMWPATADVIRIVRPRFVLLENVPGIRGYLPVVIRDLRRLGYTVRRPLQLGADDAGAPHRRKRVWILARDTESNASDTVGTVWQGQDSITGRVCATVAYTEGGEDHGRERRNMDEAIQRGQGKHSAFDSGREDVADSSGGIRQRDAQGQTGHAAQRGEDLAHSTSERCREEGADSERSAKRPTSRCEILSYSGGQGLQESTCGRIRSLHEKTRTPEGSQPSGTDTTGWRDWPVEPDVGRVAHGVASRVDRLKAIGNGQVPRVVAAAWRILTK